LKGTAPTTPPVAPPLGIPDEAIDEQWIVQIGEGATGETEGMSSV